MKQDTRGALLGLALVIALVAVGVVIGRAIDRPVAHAAHSVYIISESKLPASATWSRDDEYTLVYAIDGHAYAVSFDNSAKVESFMAYLREQGEVRK